MYEIRKEKNLLRDTFKTKRLALSKEEKEMLDAKICSAIVSLASFRYCTDILLYCPKPEEIDINPVADEAIKRGKNVFYPRCRQGGVMTYHRVTDRSELYPGYLGIGEPDESAPLLSANTENALVIVPALAFDRAGYRLGYGGGFYDRYLTGFSGTRVGVAYNDFIIQRVPRGRYDLAVGLIVTEKGVRVPDEK